MNEIKLLGDALMLMWLFFIVVSTGGLLAFLGYAIWKYYKTPPWEKR